MAQKEIDENKAEDPKKERKWADDPEPETNIIKLQVGESVACTIEEIEDSKSPDGKDQKVYHIRPIGEDFMRRLYGTTILNQYMEKHGVGDIVNIHRLEDKPSKHASPLQVYKVQSPEE